jgi:uncharacterized membrane protein
MTDLARAPEGASIAVLRPRRHSKALFHAVITPNCSLSRKGDKILIDVILAIAALFTGGFLAFGLWQVALFILADAAFVLVVVRAIQRRMRSHEEVIVLPDAVVVQRFERGRITATKRFELLGLMVESYEDDKAVCHRLALRRQGESVEIAGELSPPERSDFSKALIAALRRTGARPNVAVRDSLDLAA